MRKIISGYDYVYVYVCVSVRPTVRQNDICRGTNKVRPSFDAECYARRTNAGNPSFVSQKHGSVKQINVKPLFVPVNIPQNHYRIKLCIRICICICMSIRPPDRSFVRTTFAEVEIWILPLFVPQNITLMGQMNVVLSSVLQNHDSVKQINVVL